VDITSTMKEVRRINGEHGFQSTGRGLFCEKMLLVVSEISEALEEFRKGRGLAEIYFSDELKPEGIPIEIADAVIRIFDFCEANNIDLEDALAIKMSYNERRPFKHGKEM